MDRKDSGYRFRRGKPCPCCKHGFCKTRIRGKKQSGKAAKKRLLKRNARQQAKQIILDQLD